MSAQYPKIVEPGAIGPGIFVRGQKELMFNITQFDRF